MADLWQSYGSWILYALFFLVFLWLHGLMHGIGGSGRRGGHCGMDHGDEEHQHAPTAQPRRHADDARAESSHRHRGGC